MKEKLLQLLTRGKTLWQGLTKQKQIGVAAGALALLAAAGIGASTVEHSRTKNTYELERQAAPAWRGIYYAYLKECFDEYEELAKKDPLRTGINELKLEFCDLDGDRVPEVLFKEWHSGQDPWGYPILTIRNETVEPFLTDIPDYRGGQATVLQDKETGDYLLSLTSLTLPHDKKMPYQSFLYRLQVDGSWLQTEMNQITVDPTTGADILDKSFYMLDGEPHYFADSDEMSQFSRDYRDRLRQYQEWSYPVLEPIPSLKEDKWEDVAPEMLSFLLDLENKDIALVQQDAKENVTARPDKPDDSAAAPEWKKLYYDFIKDDFIQSSAGGVSKWGTRLAEFYDVNGDGVPEMWYVTAMGAMGTYGHFLEVRDGRVVDIPFEDENSIGISRVLRDKESGDVVLECYASTRMGASQISELYHWNDNGLELWQKMVHKGDGDAPFLIIDGQKQTFSTIAEASAALDAFHQSFRERYEVIKGIPLNLLQQASWEEASPIVVSVLNSLDGKTDFAVKAPPPAPTSQQALTPEQRGTIYELYVRHIVKVIHEHGAVDGEQTASMAVGMKEAGAYLNDLEPEHLERVKEKVPGVKFTQSIALEDLNRLQKEVYGPGAPTLTAGDLSAERYGPAVVKDPTAATFGGLASYLVYDEATGQVLVGESELADSAKSLDLVEHERREEAGPDVVKIYLDIVTYIVCRGEYENGGFYASPDGSVYAVLDRFGETEIAQSEYEKLLTTTDYDELMALIRALRDRYGLRGVESTLVLEGDPDKTADMTVERVTTEVALQEANAQSDVVVDEPTALAEAAEAYRRYYLSFLEAINALDGDLTSYCTENQRARQEKRIFEFNKDYTFENRQIYVDRDTVEFGYENDLPTVRFNTQCVNDMRERDRQNAPVEENVAHTEVVVQRENGEWRVVYTHVDNSIEFGKDRVDLTRQTLEQ